MNGWIDQLQEAGAALARRGRASLVAVVHDAGGVGSGVVWAPGYVVTNAHVAGRGRARIRFPDGTEAEARMKVRRRDLDLVILEVDGPAGVPAAIGDSDRLRAGDLVYSLGHPWGVPGAATAGVVIGRAGPMLALGLHLRPGHSGGPVVNARGEVVGINTMMNGPDVGLAIPSSAVRRSLVDAGLGRLAGGWKRAA